jgi:hypothetical protein
VTLDRAEWRPDAGREIPAERFFFIHVMKTGGTTVSFYLRTRFDPTTLFPNRELDIHTDGRTLLDRHHLRLPYVLGLSEERRHRIRGYTGHFPFVAGELLGGGFGTFTILRDPAARTVSMLRQLQRGPWSDPSLTLGPSGYETLEEAYDEAEVFESLIHNHQTKIFSMTVADEPRGFMQILDIDEARLAVAKKNLATVDVVGLTEQFGLLLDDLQARFGWDIPRDSRANATPGDARTPPSQALLRRIADDNAIDFEFYEYARELVRERRGRLSGAG